MSNFSFMSRKSHLPPPFQKLMTEEDSEIIDFYPEEFHVDMNGKKMLWQGVALLPFIDEKRLLDALNKKYPQLTDDENRRNSFGKDVIFVNEDHALYDQISSLYMKRKIDQVGNVDPVSYESKH
jgi:5'-3' exoribonuclease 2